jgi:hypothetical protein
MNLKAIQQYEMLARVSAFGERHAERFPPGTMGRRLFATVVKCVEDVAREAAAARRGQARGATAPNMEAWKALRVQVEAVRRTARALALDEPGFDQKFRLPRGNNAAHLLTASRSFAQLATDRASDFAAHGLSAAFLDDLALCIDRFEKALRDRSASRSARVGANASLKASIEAGLRAVRRLDAVVPNVLGDNPKAIAAWRTARRVGRTVRRPRQEARPETATGARALEGR